MDLTISEDDQLFRDEVVGWLASTLDPDWYRHDHESRAAYEIEWDREMHRAGWSGLWWPKEYGGLGASPMQCAIFEEESAAAGAPVGIARAGRRLVGPAIMRFGTDEQKRILLPPILSADDLWAQGFSEPNAGSDLASLRTQAMLSSDGHYVVNGSKIWTSNAQRCNKCFLLARTDLLAEKHAGISLLLLDMDSPGIEVVPIRRITGDTDLTQVFFTDVEVPADQLLGGAGNGWNVAKYILNHERGPTLAFRRLIEIERMLHPYQARAWAQPAEAVQAARLSVEVAAARLLAYRVLGESMKDMREMPSTATGLKLYWSHIGQRVAERIFAFGGEDALNLSGADASNDPGTMYLSTRHFTISAGASEIQRTIIAQRVLKMPRTA